MPSAENQYIVIQIFFPTTNSIFPFTKLYFFVRVYLFVHNYRERLKSFAAARYIICFHRCLSAAKFSYWMVPLGAGGFSLYDDS